MSELVTLSQVKGRLSRREIFSRRQWHDPLQQSAAGGIAMEAQPETEIA
jgi:hypothetical protein